MTCSRGLLLAGAAVAIASAGRVAHADTGMLPNNAQLEWPRVYIADDNGDLIEPPDPETFRERLNLASCLCSQSMTGDTDLYYELHLSATTGINPTGDLYVGSQCEDDIQRPMLCRKVGTVGDLDVLAVQEDSFPVRLYDLINATPADSSMACRQVDNGEAFVWVISDTDNNSDPDFFSPRPLDLDKFADVMGFDTKPPPPLENLKATGSEQSIQVSWDIPVSNATDFYAFQALCMDASGAPAKTADDRLYATTDSTCGIPQMFALDAIDNTNPDGTPVGALPAPFAALDPAYICKTEPSGTATGITIDGLENNQPYTVAIVAVDFYGNASGAYFTTTVVPKPATDLWEDIHDRGGKIEGGFCNAGGATELPGLFAILGLAYLARRRRSWLVRAGGALVLVCVVAPRAARADDFTPYWEDTSAAEEALEEDHVRWHAGIKIGPWTPEIDDQLGTNATTGMGPYQAMFGNYYLDGKAHDAHVYQLLPMLDVDYVVWRGSGQAAVGVTLGYMQKSAYTYLDMTSPDDPQRPRSGSSKNTFRLIPFALTATYRATQLDDLWGIPVVPYVRGGLAYYVWQMKGPTGSTSFVCSDGTMETGCDKNKAYGGTLGYTGTIGLSLRAERIDANAASSMRQSGIQHAGFYGELTMAKVDGFGSDKRLSVGDRTWFAGIDFEF
ncbi:MAG TPA: MXAN_2562 family outer membrane beta-barrel protein [Kofleriaceae bacterium]|nr:MXAN_2562 family outer membrane beta-barrel protein [Kofleriaceae bacterium]